MKPLRLGSRTEDRAHWSALQAQYDDLNDRYLRMAAEYDNFRKRSRAERDSVHAEAVAYAVKALLATVDNLSRALAQPTEDAAYKQGIEMTVTTDDGELPVSGRHRDRLRAGHRFSIPTCTMQ